MNQYFEKFRNMEPYFKIEEEEWTHIKETFSKEEIKESLVKVLMEYPPPYADISEKECLKDYNRLKGIKWNDLYINKQWFARSEYDWERSSNLIKRLNVGNKASNYFQQKNRWSVDGTVSPGPLRTWENKKFMYTLLGSLFTLKVPKVTKATLRTSISLRKYICSQFKPNVSKVLYDKLRSENVLDFSAGWGDRLAGFYTSETAEYYVGIDPRKENHSIYEEQSEFYEKHRTMFEPKKKVELICSPAEDVDYTKYKDKFDTVFTSPPYFSVERYSYEDTQSWVRYKQIDDWNRNFLQKTIENLWCSIKSGGYLLVNIADVFARTGSDKGMVEICNPMNDFLYKFSDSEYQGCIGMEMAKRQNSGGAGMARGSDERFQDSTIQRAEETKDKRFAEPIWIWRKN